MTLNTVGQTLLQHLSGQRGIVLVDQINGKRKTQIASTSVSLMSGWRVTPPHEGALDPGAPLWLCPTRVII